jgi:hypothetical protein
MFVLAEKETKMLFFAESGQMLKKNREDVFGRLRLIGRNWVEVCAPLGLKN